MTLKLAVGFLAVAEGSLLDAAEYGSLKEVEELLSEDVNQRDEHGQTPLMAVAYRNSLSKVKAILSKDPDVDLQAQNGMTALMVAARYSEPDIVKAILERNPDVRLQNQYGWTALMSAAPQGNVESVEAILASGAVVNHQSHTGFTALGIAAQQGFIALAAELLDGGALIDLPDFAGRTPLYLASEAGHFKMVEYLLSRAARPEIIARNAQTALVAAQKAQQLCIEEHGEAQTTASCQKFQPTVEQLESVTPYGWGLFKARLHTPGCPEYLSIAAVLGVFSGFAWHCFWKNCTDHSVHLGQQKLAIKMVVQNASIHKGLRMVEIVACLLFPLGIAMLFIRAMVMLPLYILAYIIPRFWELGVEEALRHPVLVLAGLGKGRMDRMSKISRLIATAILLVVTAVMPWHCDEDIHYYIFGEVDFANQTYDMLDTLMVHGAVGLPLLSRVNSQLGCFEFNGMEPIIRWCFFGYFLVVWLITLSWLIASLAEMAEIYQLPAVSEAELQQVDEVAEKLSGTQTSADVSSIHFGNFRVKEEGEGEINWWIFLTLMHFVLDSIMIFNLLQAGQAMLASVLIAIIVTSMMAEAHTTFRVLSCQELLNLPKESVARGFLTQPLAQLLEIPKDFQVPLSTAISSFAWMFAIQGYVSFFTSLSALLLGVYALGSAIFLLEDADLYRSKAKKMAARHAYKLMPIDGTAGRLSPGKSRQR